MECKESEPRLMEAQGSATDEGCVIAMLDADGNLEMVVDPMTLPPELFRILFPSGTPGKSPETVRVSMLRGQSLANRSQSAQGESCGYSENRE
jgi:hypothetical protein